ncbi:toxin-activating lysine-acyltransferase [Leclercia adecarboxylata]|uniref:toxin-activating lysine-acyltransferase n=1 Tax=Leclercia adecarboxylata TaxID=83655 RepID=UPI001CEF5CF0|nr:toxin-activating lysine-acyltransferase [Leclercia adecarboxylata]
MRYGELTVHCPLLHTVTLNEAEVLGASVWLWMHSLNHRDAPLHALPVVLLPIIKRQQYVLVEEKGRPIFFLSWAWMSEEAERRYLTEATVVLPEEDWCSGDRLWFRDFKGLSWGVNTGANWWKGGWDPKFNADLRRFTEVKGELGLSKERTPSYFPGMFGDIGGSLGSELSGKYIDQKTSYKDRKK